MKLLAGSVATLFTVASISLAAVYLPKNSVQIEELSKESLSLYDSVFSNSGYKILGNNLFVNNETKELADIDSQELTTNSSAVGLPKTLEFSEAILVYAVDATKLNVNKQSSNILISSDGKNYATKNITTFGSKNGHTIGITKLTMSDLARSDSLYVSLPILEDSENYSRINMAAFYIILLDSSGDTINNFNMSFENDDSTSLAGLSLKTGEIKGISEASKRIPNNGFTKMEDVIAGKSPTGNFGIAENGFIYLNVEETSIPRPAISTGKFLKQSSDNPTDSFESDISLPSRFANAEFKVILDSNYNYVNNTSLIPAGSELSGPLTDVSGDDIFSYSGGIMTWHFNSGKYQLNTVNKTKLRFLMDTPIFEGGIFPIIEYKIGDETRRVKGNYLQFSYLNNWQDVALTGEVSPLNKTSAKIKLAVISNSDLGASGEINFSLPKFTAITKKELERNFCEASEYNKVSCKVNITKGFTQINLNILTRRELTTITFSPITLNLYGDYTDPNYSNNTVLLRGNQPDK